MSRKDYRESNPGNCSVDDMIGFAIEREKIRKLKESGSDKPFTSDPILLTSSFCNIFREDDKMSKWLFKQYEQYASFNFSERWLMIYMGRWFNRKDVLSKLFPFTDPKKQIDDLVDSGVPLMNPMAYQFFPTELGRKWGYRDIRSVIKGQLLEGYWRTLKVVRQLNNANIKDTVVALSNAWGSAGLFWMLQCVLDLGQTTNGFIDLSSTVYEGAGGREIYKLLDGDATKLATKVNNKWEDKKRKLHPFDIEQLTCEYRKWKVRAIEGVPQNRKYNGEAA